MSEADDKSSVEEKTENLLQSGMSVQAAVPEGENVDRVDKPIIVLPVAIVLGFFIGCLWFYFGLSRSRAVSL